MVGVMGAMGYDAVRRGMMQCDVAPCHPERSVSEVEGSVRDDGTKRRII